MFGDNVTQGFVAPLVVAVVVRAYLKQVRLTGLQVPQLAKIVEEVSEVGDRRRERRKVIVFDVCRLTYERPFSRESVTGSRVQRTVFLGGHHLNDFEPRQEPRFVRTYEVPRFGVQGELQLSNHLCYTVLILCATNCLHQA